MVGGVLSVIDGGENACEFCEEVEIGDTPQMLNLNFEGPVCAPMRVVEAESWLVDY